jgi:GTP-sensing pleiotropic transcriptional regulator CodY
MLREKIISELKNKKDGYTISELAKQMKISRHVVANTFAFLEGAGKIEIRSVGMAKIVYWRGK